MRRKPNWRPGGQTRALEQGQRIEAVIDPASVEVRLCPKSNGVIGPGVVDDLPRLVPVLESELEVVETYLGELLDTLGWPQ
jgi:hypothetical protein